jgi:hypothetical protein
MTMRCGWIEGVAISLALAAGCEYDRYAVEMTPDGDSCRRVLTCWREETNGGKDEVPTLKPLPQEELDRIAKLYPNEPQESGPAKRIFTGCFKGALPSDVGGAGTYTRLTTELGDLFTYSERFRGDDDQARVLADMSYAADRLTDVLILWFEPELKEDPHWPKLRGFMETDLRQDIKNGALYLWMAGPAGNLEWSFARAAQYFQERGYFQPQDVPAWKADSPAGGKLVMEIVRRFVASRMGLTPEAPAPPSLGFLSSDERAEASWDRFRAESPAYRDWLAALDLKRLRWKPREDAARGKDKPDVKDSLGDLLGPSLVMLAGDDADHVGVTLVCKVAPLYTNGTYDAAKGAIAWSEALRKSPFLPVLCTATWDASDESFQKAHFGRTVLAGEDLAAYVLWRKLLSEADAKEWMAFLDALKPDGGLVEKVKAFRFLSDPKPAPGATGSLANQPRDLILKALAPPAK